jgi:hypothetical protein
MVSASSPLCSQFKKLKEFSLPGFKKLPVVCRVNGKVNQEERRLQVQQIPKAMAA